MVDEKQEKKLKLDDLIVNMLTQKSENIFESPTILSLEKKVPNIVYIDYDRDSILADIVSMYYENALEAAEKSDINDIGDNRKFMGPLYNRTSITVKELMPKNRKYKKRNSKDRNVQIDYIEPMSLYTKDDEGKEYLLDIIEDKKIAEQHMKKNFITKWWINNYEIIFTKSPKSLDYIEHPYPRATGKFSIDKRTGKSYERRVDYVNVIRTATYKAFNKEFGTNLKKAKKKDGKYQECLNSLYIDLAEIKNDINTIDEILSSKDIGKKFNQHKNEPVLFDILYENLSTESRASINNKYYSIKSILELKSELTKQKSILKNKLEKKEKEIELYGKQ